MEGEFRAGKLFGFGKFHDTRNNLKYEGTFKQDMFHGRGKCQQNQVEVSQEFVPLVMDLLMKVNLLTTNSTDTESSKPAMERLTKVNSPPSTLHSFRTFPTRKLIQGCLCSC